MSVLFVLKDVKNKSWLALKRQAPIFNHEKAVEQWLTSKIRPDATQPLTWEWLDAALIFVLKKIGGTILAGVHTAMLGVNTLADRIAWILLKGIDLTENISHFVKLFIEKIMQILRMPPLVGGVGQVTQSFLTSLLAMLMRTAYAMAKKAVQAV